MVVPTNIRCAIAGSRELSGDRLCRIFQSFGHRAKLCSKFGIVRLRRQGLRPVEREEIVAVAIVRLAELATRVDEARSRGVQKVLGKELDRDPALHALALALARKRGLEVGPGMPGKKLVRVLRDRQERSRERSNPIRKDPGFVCHWCGADVPPGGAMVRDHCPRCLRGRHVDVVPGDRAADCGGVLEPVGFDLEGRAGVVIRYRCRSCGNAWRGRAHPDARAGRGCAEPATQSAALPDRYRRAPQYPSRRA